MARKIIQVATTPAPVSTDPGKILALCDDGTVWIRTDNDGASWALQSNVPQDG